MYPYVGRSGRYDLPNPMLEVTHAELVAREPEGFGAIRSITTQNVPPGPSSALLHLIAADGILGSPSRCRAASSGSSRTEKAACGSISGFAVWRGPPAHHAVEQLVDRIMAEHTFEPPRADDEPFEGSATLAVLYRRIWLATLRFGSETGSCAHTPSPVKP